MKNVNIPVGTSDFREIRERDYYYMVKLIFIFYKFSVMIFKTIVSEKSV